MDNKKPIPGKLYKITYEVSFHNEENTWHPVLDKGVVILVSVKENAGLLNPHSLHYILPNGRYMFHTIPTFDKFWDHFEEIQ